MCFVLSSRILAAAFLVLVFMPGLGQVADDETDITAKALEQAGEENWVEVAVVVHGITPNRKVPENDPAYSRFRQNLKQTFYRMRLNHEFSYPFGPHNTIEIFYGSRLAIPLSGDNPSNNIEQLQQIIGEFDAKTWQQTEDSPESLLRQTAFRGIRELLLYGISDAFYYNSDQGGKAIRSVILEQIFAGLQKCGILDSEGMLPKPYKLSITIFAHSLGAIVMYDLLETIYNDDSDFGDAVDDPLAIEILSGFQKLKQSGRVRVNRFFSMGTQLSVMYFKYDNSVDMLMQGSFRSLDHIFSEDDGLSDPRWINLWDKDDILGYPFEFLFRPREGTGTRIIVDRAVDAGDYLPHIAYWWSQDVAEEILLSFFRLDRRDKEAANAK